MVIGKVVDLTVCFFWAYCFLDSIKKHYDYVIHVVYKLLLMFGESGEIRGDLSISHIFMSYYTLNDLSLQTQRVYFHARVTLQHCQSFTG